ncbi:MAG: L-threonylcarbamoyladenylate synthase [Planctomycetota bacterium]
MSAEKISLTTEGDHRDEIRRAARILADGGLVAFPTETVYGVAANAANESAVKRLRALKGLTTDQPFTVHIGRREDWGDFVSVRSAMAERFVRKGWPGPLTLILPVEDPSRTKVHERLGELGSRSIYANGTVSIRFPDYPAAEQLLSESGVPVIASGANLPGDAVPTDGDGLETGLGDRVDVILDGGPTRYRKVSTVVSVDGNGYKLLREGVWDARTIRSLATLQVLFVCSGNTCRSPMAEGLFRHMMAERIGCRDDELAMRGVVIRSAGTSAHGGGGVSEEAVGVCLQRGVDIAGHRSQRLAMELIHSADYIYTMAAHHADVVRSLVPSAAWKVTTLAGDEEITDPIGGSVDEYVRVADRIELALKKRLDEVSP